MIVRGEVVEALTRGGPVVALESTLIAHGLPWPDNLETAREAEEAVRQAGAVPATMAVLDGEPRIGLGASDLERLARARDVLKAGRRDLAFAVARGLDAATTVSATLWLARRSGIGLMATGGLGGVHREAATTFDVSNDLDELARADGMAVVCSGAKSILDLPATLEVLETLGVPVVGYRTDTLPAFLSRSSGLPLPTRVNDPAGAAAIVEAHRALRLPGAVVIAQPVPADVALDPDELERALAKALRAASASGVRGKALTPFLLGAIREATGGRALAANRALIVANARLAGEVAVACPGAPQRPSEVSALGGPNVKNLRMPST
jgi:pseudouridine-5'-phosphate glycosidase